MKQKDYACVPFCSFALQHCFLGDYFVAETEKIPIVQRLKNEHVTRSLTSTVSQQICRKEGICRSSGSDELSMILKFDSLSSVLLNAV